MDEIDLETRTVLLVTTLQGVENLASAVSESVFVVVEIARSRRAALAALRKQAFSAVIVDTALPLNEVTSTDLLWQNAAGAVPLELDLRALGTAAVVRLLRNVLDRRSAMEATVREELTRAMADDLRSTVTGMLLQSDLALRDQTLSPVLEQRFRQLRSMADDLRIRLRAA